MRVGFNTKAASGGRRLHRQFVQHVGESLLFVLVVLELPTLAHGFLPGLLARSTGRQQASLCQPFDGCQYRRGVHGAPWKLREQADGGGEARGEQSRDRGVGVEMTDLEDGEDSEIEVNGDSGGGQDQGKRSRWPWRRRQNNGEREDKQESKGFFTYDWDNGDRVVWSASKKSHVEVEEGPRKLRDYLALPPTEYSLLDPSMITRLSEETFRMNSSTISIAGTKIKPVLFVRVEVQPDNSLANIMVERVELEGSEAVRSAGGSFNVTSSTVVSCSEKEGAREAKVMELRTSADIEVELLLPNENFVPPGVLRRAGNFVMQRVVDIGLPQFTKFLKRDYARWAEGDDSRNAVVSEGETLISVDDT